MGLFSKCWFSPAQGPSSSRLRWGSSIVAMCANPPRSYWTIVMLRRVERELWPVGPSVFEGAPPEMVMHSQRRRFTLNILCNSHRGAFILKVPSPTHLAVVCLVNLSFSWKFSSPQLWTLSLPSIPCPGLLQVFYCKKIYLWIIFLSQIGSFWRPRFLFHSSYVSYCLSWHLTQGKGSEVKKEWI